MKYICLFLLLFLGLLQKQQSGSLSLGACYLVDLENGDHLGKSSKLKKKMWKIEGGGFKKGQFSTLFQKYVEFFPSLFPTLWATHSKVRLGTFLKGKYIFFPKLF